VSFFDQVLTSILWCLCAVFFSFRLCSNCLTTIKLDSNFLRRNKYLLWRVRFQPSSTGNVGTDIMLDKNKYVCDLYVGTRSLQHVSLITSVRMRVIFWSALDVYLLCLCAVLSSFPLYPVCLMPLSHVSNHQRSDVCHLLIGSWGLSFLSLCSFLFVSFMSWLSHPAFARDPMSLRPVRGNQGVCECLRGRKFNWTSSD